MKIVALLTVTMLVFVPASVCAQTENDDDYFLGLLDGKPVRDLDKKLAKAAQFSLGSPENPIRVYDPAGEVAYLRRLRCEDGRRPAFNRTGSAGLGPFDHIIDDYLVTCPGSKPAESHIFMDMYFPNYIETKAPEGFTIVP